MYGNGGWDQDGYSFTVVIQDLDRERDYHYASKLDVANSLDNIFDDQHHVCAAAGFGHGSEKK